MGKLLVSAMNAAPELTGCGKYTGELVFEMARRGHAVEVVTTPPHYPEWKVRPPYRNRYSYETADNGARIWRAPLFLHANMGGIWRLLAPLSFAVSSAPLTLWRALRHRPDTLLSIEPTLFAAPAVLLAARLVGGRTVLHVQDLEVDAAFAVGHLRGDGMLQRLGLAFERFCLRRFDMVVTISFKMAEGIVAKGVAAERVRVVRNWIDLEHVRPLPASRAYREELGLPPDAFLALYSGNFGPKQGLDILVEAARILAGRPDIAFAIAGEGPSKPELTAAAADLPNVHFLPFQPYERLPDFLALADLHLLPQQESAGDLVLPSKLGGMLASGRPIVVTTLADTELGTFLDGASTIVPPGDPRVLAEAIARHADGSTRDTRNAQAAVAALLSAPNAMTEFENLLFAPSSLPSRFPV